MQLVFNYLKHLDLDSINLSFLYPKITWTARIEKQTGYQTNKT